MLLDAISEGSLAPGTRITQEEIAEQLSVCAARRCCRRCACSKKDGLRAGHAPGRGRSSSTPCSMCSVDQQPLRRFACKALSD